MGTDKSSHADTKSNTEEYPKGLFQTGESVGGLKSSSSDSDVILVSLSEVISLSSTDWESSDSEDYDSEDDIEEDPEVEEFLAERRMILDEAEMLKNFAHFHLHPEKNVISKDPFACGRNFFSRLSADETENIEEAEERAKVMEEAALLKQYANFHLHPEKPVVVTDAMASGRNYFNRASAPEQESMEEAEERAMVLEEASLLKKYAEFHLHPEKPVVSTDTTACGRNFFVRASAPEQESMEEAEERAKVLEEAAMLKQYAGFHLHPEKPVLSTDATACGRNYFVRASAPEQESMEEAEERAKVLEEASLFKKYAEFHLHPEKPVVSTDPLASGRNYFTRASAPEQESTEEAEERAKVLEEAAMLKQYAEFHLHPEKPVVSSDAMANGRNYFVRASAPEQESMEEAEERAKVLEEASLFKKYAEFHLHPEKPVVSTDPLASGRNYFTRASAPEQESVEESEERAMVLEEIALLKKYAEFHLHPEKPVVSSDAMASGRNFFVRASAPEQESMEEAEERAKVLEEAAMLKQYAGFHLHPEKPVLLTDATAGGRNYFVRASAPGQESVEESEERAIVLEEIALFKKYAEFHLHPEKPVVSTDSFAGGRNFFARASAPEQVSMEEAEERAKVLEEASLLKKYAEFHLHPEKPVVSSDSMASGRNYFVRASAPEQESMEEAEERAKVLEDASLFKKYAEFHLHPEKPVVSTDPLASGRNYFCRPSAPLTGVTVKAQASGKEQKIKEPSVQGMTKQVTLQQAPHKHSTNDGNETEEATINRSPSSIMLFGYEDNEAF